MFTDTMNQGQTEQPVPGIWRSLALWGVFGALTVPVVLLAGLALLLGGGGSLAHAVHLWWCRRSVRLLGIRLRVINSDRIVRDRPTIFVANHQSILDIIVLGAVLGLQYRWLAKADLFRIPVLGWGMRRTGYIPVERGHGQRAKRSFYQAARRVRAGNSLVVFPEGTVTPDGNLLPFRRGGFIIARQAQATVQCLSISNTFALLPDQEDRWIPRFRSGEVRVFVHEPMEPGEFGKSEVSEVMARCRSQIATEIKTAPFE